MVQYSLAQSPEVILTVSGKDSAKAREKAMDQLMELMDAGKLPTNLAEGFSPSQLIKVKELETDVASDEDAVTLESLSLKGIDNVQKVHKAVSGARLHLAGNDDEISGIYPGLGKNTKRRRAINKDKLVLTRNWL